jgi:nitric oxide reductase subunit C
MCANEGENMKYAILWLVLVAAITAGCFAGLIYYSFVRVTPRDISETAYEGKKVWEEYSCVQCHPIFGNGGYSAPDLTNVASLRSKEWLEQFFAEPPILKPSKSNKHISLESAEREKIIEYFKYINEIKKNNWPPPPRKDLESSNLSKEKK